MLTADLSPRVGAPHADLELVITRIFDAPRELVFKAWSEPDRAIRWWGPHGFTTAHCEMDVRPGGAYRVCVRSPEGTEHWQRGICREVVEPERLVFTFAWEDAQGMPGHETVVSVTFAEHGARSASGRLGERPGLPGRVSGAGLRQPIHHLLKEVEDAAPDRIARRMA